MIIILNLAENPNKGGRPPRDNKFKDRIVLLNKESFLEKMLLTSLIWLLKKNRMIENERNV